VPNVPIPRRYTTDAIVLSRFDYGEADRILTLITPNDGKLKAIAKGIRRPTSRIGGSLEPFAELHVALARGRTFEVVTQVSVGHAWLNLRDSLESAATAWYIAELADRSLEERHAAEPVYTLLRRAYELLDAGMAPGRVARWYEMHLADELGVRPEVDRCVECDRALEVDGRFRWVPPLGGVLCDRCPGPPHDRAGLSLDGLKLLKAYQRQDVEAIAALRLSPETEREVESAMRDFLRVALDRDARSLAFLDEIRTPEAAERHARHDRAVAERDAAAARDADGPETVAVETGVVPT
jgi:DNA repair protein RecO (recombination protein O)